MDTYIFVVCDWLDTEREELNCLFLEIVQLLFDLPHFAILVSQVFIWSCKDQELTTLKKIRNPDGLFHELLKMERPLLEETSIFWVSKEATLGQFRDV